MLRELSSEARGRKDFQKPSHPGHVGIHWIALAKYSDEYPFDRVSVILSVLLHTFVLAKLATSSIRVKRQNF